MAEALQEHRQDLEPAAAERQDFEAAPVENVSAADATTRTETRTDADQLANTCDTTAAEIEATGAAVMQVAHSIANETQALAELLRKHADFDAGPMPVDEVVVFSSRLERTGAIHERLGAGPLEGR